jgi:cell division septation protein DedD
MSRLLVTRALFALSVAAPLAGAQQPAPASASTLDSVRATPAMNDPIPRPANDSLFRRARRMVSEGNGAAGRALVDSLLAATDPSTPAYGDALYWHGALAPTAAAAEADYRRVIVEYPLAYYSGDALLAIAELEQARGDRAGAMQHLQRFVREHPDNPGRGIAALGVARLAFEQRDTTLACSMLVEARRSMAPTDVELRNQVEYYGSRCASAPAGAVASAPAPARTPATSAPAANTSVTSPPAASASAPASAPARTATATPAPARATRAAPAARTVTRYTVQVAAYNTRADADALVKRLAARGVKARVSGASKPFRVRLALHATRKAASDELSAMRNRGIEGFVAEEEVNAGARTP